MDFRRWLRRKALQTIRLGLQDCFPVEAMMHPNDDFLSAPELDYDGFRAAMREDWGWFSPVLEVNVFHRQGAHAARLRIRYRGSRLQCYPRWADETGHSPRRHAVLLRHSPVWGRIDNHCSRHTDKLFVRERRALMKTGQPLSDIAYACGFRDYTD
jgi:hypothetical protein